MRLKKDFRSRLILLRNEINVVLSSDSLGSVKLGSLFPRLASVYRFIWCNIDSSFLIK